MENRFKLRISCMFPSSFRPCWSRNVSAVTGKPKYLTRNHQNSHLIEPFSPKVQKLPSMNQHKWPEISHRINESDRYLCLSSDTGTYISHLSSYYKETNTKKSKIMKKKKKRESNRFSCSSIETKGGWFSSEEVADVRGITEIVFSSDSSEFYRPNKSSSHQKMARTRRRRSTSKIYEMGHCPFEVSVSSTDLYSKFGSFRRKTAETIRGIAETGRKTNKSRRRRARSKSYEMGSCPFEVSMSSNHPNALFRSFHRKTTDTRITAEIHRETTDSRRRRGKSKSYEMGSCPFEVSMGSSDIYNDFGQFRQKTEKNRQRRGRSRSSELGRQCPFVREGKVKESFAVVKSSRDPYSDFRTSVVEMIVEKQIFGSEELEELLQCFLSLNSSYHHKIIVEVFSEILEVLFSD